MSLVDKDDMTTLRSAADSRATASTAEHDIQIKAVAYAINNAANCGQYRVIFQEVMRDDVKSDLEAQGYVIRKDEFVSSTERSTLISWSDSGSK